MDRVVLYDQKRLKLLRRARLFNWAPFIEKVYIAGSVALGRVHENSDFDVIVVTQPGRLYTCRFFCLLLFGLMGWRRTLRNPKDGFCFNHFITSSVFVTPDYYHNDRWDSNRIGFAAYEKELYKNLIETPIRRFTPSSPAVHDGVKSKSKIRFLELIIKSWQVTRIKKFLKKFPPSPNSRIIYNDERVELCLNLKKW